MLNSIIYINRYSFTQDSYGQPKKTRVLHQKRWASVKNNSGGWLTSNEKSQWSFDLIFKVRDSEDLAILTSDIIEYRGKEYRIVNRYLKEDNGDREGSKFEFGVFEFFECKTLV